MSNLPDWIEFLQICVRVFNLPSCLFPKRLFVLFSVWDLCFLYILQPQCYAMLPILPSSGRTIFFALNTKWKCIEFCISFLLFLFGKRFVSLWDGKPGHSFRWRASQCAFPQVNSPETFIGNGKFGIKIFYTYFICVSFPFCLQTIKADTVDYWLCHNSFAASISISRCFLANLLWCTKPLCRFPSVCFLFSQKHRDLDGENSN